jgi:hypothetical protein
MDFRNAVYLEDGRIDCEFNHPARGWVPFTADPNGDAREQAVFAAAQATAAPYVPPEMTPEERERIVGSTLDGLMDAAAIERGYKSYDRLITYIHSQHPVWSADAAALVAWRDALWLKVAELEALPAEEQPTSIEALIAELPQITWPGEE